MRCWKFFLPIFKSAKHTNYSIEAFTLLAKYYYLFSPRMAAQLAWSQTVNTHGYHVSCNLHLKHLNQEMKNALGGLSSNITDLSVKRISESIGALSEMSLNFDTTNSVPAPSAYHTSKPRVKDVKVIVEQLKHSNFKQDVNSFILKSSLGIPARPQTKLSGQNEEIDNVS